MSARANPVEPVPLRVESARQESLDVVTLTLRAQALGGAPQAFQPGQFNMLYAFGVGEVAISMSGDASNPGVLVHTIKAVGAVTEALCSSKAGSVIGVRGPYGTPWPTSDAGSDLLIVAGGLGLAPLRPMVYHALAQRSRYGRVALLVGARTPQDLIFGDELDAWRARGDIDVLVTVDRAEVGWKGRVGVVTALLSDVAVTANTLALVCGPEVMMRYSVRELARRGLPDERIYLSLERNMKCAVGFCGHCQLGPNFVCKDGPVFRYDRVRSLFWLREY